MSEKESHINRLKEALQKVDQEIIGEESVLSSAQEKANSLHIEKQEKTRIAEKIKSELRSIQEKVGAFETEKKALGEKISLQKTKIAQMQAEFNVLEEAEKSLTGYEEGARILIQAMKDKHIQGAVGSLGNYLLIPEEFETAIAAVMGEYINSLIIESINQTDKALDLIGNETTRGSLFPLDVITPPRALALDLEKAPVETGNILGVASHLVQVEPRLKQVVDLLFGHVIVVKDRKTARTILASRDWRDMPDVRIVTLKGEMYLTMGPIITGASGKGILSRPRQRRESKSFLDAASSILEELDEQYRLIDQNISDLQELEKASEVKHNDALDIEKNVTGKLTQQELQIEKMQRNLQWHHDQKNRYQTDLESELLDLTKTKKDSEIIQEELNQIKTELDANIASLDSLPLDELQGQYSYWITKSAVIERALSDARNRQQEKLRQLNQFENNLSTLMSRSEQLDQEIKVLNESLEIGSGKEMEIAKTIEELGKTVNPHEEQLIALESDQNNLISTDTEARQQLRVAEQRYTQSKINLAHHLESFESLRRHIEDDFGLVSFDYPESVSGPKPLPLDGLVEELPHVDDLSSDLKDTIRQQKAQMRRMGAINPEAQSEYKEVKERFEFLSSQVDDLNKAEGDIKEIIVELDILMEREFRRTFDAVAQEFRQIFTRLFGGGSARLALTDPENMTETGIDIEARLPGRREQGLSLLSGGERSLTATALVFALLRVSPTPFCILDEVDAMLDEANVGRFRDLLTELSEKTQFIVITHNRNTVQAASIIYGVTMGRDSASQVISLKMDDLGEEFGV